MDCLDQRIEAMLELAVHGQVYPHNMREMIECFIALHKRRADLRAQLTAAEKRATEAHQDNLELAMRCGLLTLLVEKIPKPGENPQWGRDDWIYFAKKMRAEIDNLPARAQAVAEVLANAKEIYSDHNANDPRDEDASDCWCGTCNAVRKLAALDKEPQ